MTKYHGHSVWIAVFLKSNNGAVWELYKGLVIHFETRVTPLSLVLQASNCSPQCSREQGAPWPCALLVMNDYSQPRPGKIELHGNGLGAPSSEEVERRAREIAMIDERDPDEFTEADWKQARRELMGEENNTPPEETSDNADLTEEWNVIASSKGHRIPRPGTEEEETIGEQCVVDGLEEAAHDQMLEARLEELEQEGEIL